MFYNFIGFRESHSLIKYFVQLQTWAMNDVKQETFTFQLFNLNQLQSEQSNVYNLGILM